MKKYLYSIGLILLLLVSPGAIILGIAFNNVYICLTGYIVLVVAIVLAYFDHDTVDLVYDEQEKLIQDYRDLVCEYEKIIKAKSGHKATEEMPTEVGLYMVAGIEKCCLARWNGSMFIIQSDTDIGEIHSWKLVLSQEEYNDK